MAKNEYMVWIATHDKTIEQLPVAAHTISDIEETLRANGYECEVIAVALAIDEITVTVDVEALTHGS